MILFIDGQPAKPEHLAHQALVNYGAYTSFRVEQYGVRGLGLHLARLAASAQDLFGEAIPEPEIRAQIRVALGERSEAWLRLSLFAPEISNRDLTFTGRPRLMVGVFDPPPPLAAELRVMTVAHERHEPHHKHLGQFSLLRARRLARQAGFDDALFLDRRGHITEGTLWNIGFLSGATAVWPEAPMLAGVTQALIDHQLPNVGLSSRTEPITLADLNRFEAAFFCNSATPAGAIMAIDGRPFPRRADLIERLTAAWTAAPAEPI